MWPFKKKVTEDSSVQVVTDGAPRSDPQRLQELLAAVQQQMQEGADPAVVSLDLYFTGNEDQSSIGANIDPPPGPRQFQEVLNNIALRPEVYKVLVEVLDTRQDIGGLHWPTSRCVYILSRCDIGQIGKWLAPLEPSTLSEEVTNLRIKSIGRKPGTNEYQATWN